MNLKLRFLTRSLIICHRWVLSLSFADDDVNNRPYKKGKRRWSDNSDASA